MTVEITCDVCSNCYGELRKFRCYADEKQRTVDEFIIHEEHPDWCPLTNPKPEPKVET